MRIAKVVAGFGLCVIALFVANEAASAATKCSEIFMPVCGLKAGVRMTYSNACFARQAGASVLHTDTCLAPTPSSICFFLENPVCAIPPGKKRAKRYGNLCLAEVANARLVPGGACK